MADLTTVSAGALKTFCIDLLCSAAKTSKDDASIIADNLIAADIRGVRTHGVTRLKAYLDLVKAGMINTSYQLQTTKDCLTTLALDADNTFGQIGAYHGMKSAIQRAEKYGFSYVVVGNSGHIGALAHWSMMALEHDMIGICMTNTSRVMAAHGSSINSVGNNPLSIAAPSSTAMPLLLDMALSVAARGNLAVAIREQKDIPLGWAIDAEGRPTTDPAAGTHGAMLPIGGYKGSGLSLMIEILTAVLSNSPIGSQTGSLVPPSTTKPLGLSHSFMAIKINNFIEIGKFKERVSLLMKDIQQSEKASLFDGVMVPNEKEFIASERNLKNGITLGQTLFSELGEIAKEHNVPFLQSKQ